MPPLSNRLVVARVRERTVWCSENTGGGRDKTNKNGVVPVNR